MSHLPVLVELSTYNRSFTTLPLVLQSIISQTVLPGEVWLFDDRGEDDLLGIELYKSIFKTLDFLGIKWEVRLTPQHGAVRNHEYSRENSPCPYVWRLDDDTVPQSNVLEILYQTISSSDSLGAVGGLVLEPGSDKSPFSSNMEDFDTHWCGQMNSNYEGGSVDHMYSTFLYRKAASSTYPELSRVGFREETFFTYQMKLDGWELMVRREAITWHYHYSGGLRDLAKRDDLWSQDEEKFREWLRNPTVKNPR